MTDREGWRIMAQRFGPGRRASEFMYAYFGHHRCATLWTASIVRAISREFGWQVAQEDRYNKLPDALSQTDFLIHLNATENIVQQLAERDFRGFHVIRDPRDILVSSYFSDKYSHPIYRPEFAQFREQLNATEFDAGLRLEMDRRAAEFSALAEWDYRNPRIYETRYEVLTAAPFEEFSRILAFLEAPLIEDGAAAWVTHMQLIANRALHRLKMPFRVRRLPAAWLRKIIARQSFQKLAGRKRGQEDPKSHYRKGVAGDWKNYLTGANKDLFKERWGQLLVDLGYEKDLSW